MLRARLAPLAAALFVVLTVATIAGCDSRPTTTRSLAPREGAFALTNWRSVKLPIHAVLSTTEATVGDYADGSCASTQGIRATAYDGNGRVIADSLIDWSSDSAQYATVDSLGFVTIQGCGAAPQIAWQVGVAGIRATLRDSAKYSK